ncbi:hypothetical protein L873DRAFT_348068 [Choiromyces venosus 120613-1]|uniref:Uncharacterized protein n=1 Tax=Choiromyces venosus 120613-1 TaxID=1336337 RepID=A0A3N4JBD6_9PEZI|nr:hypothetical protein L873DRAFT_348068 [Choiromyces venosus 120613-1]
MHLSQVTIGRPCYMESLLPPTVLIGYSKESYLSISFLHPRGLPPLTNTTPSLLYKYLKFRYPRLELYCSLPVFLENKILPVSVKVVL